jgi:chloramphenicol O-acetyltransferase
MNKDDRIILSDILNETRTTKGELREFKEKMMEFKGEMTEFKQYATRQFEKIEKKECEQKKDRHSFVAILISAVALVFSIIFNLFKGKV